MGKIIKILLAIPIDKRTRLGNETLYFTGKRKKKKQEKKEGGGKNKITENSCE